MSSSYQRPSCAVKRTAGRPAPKGRRPVRYLAVAVLCVGPWLLGFGSVRAAWADGPLPAPPERVVISARDGSATSAVFYRPSAPFSEAVLVLPAAGESPMEWSIVAEAYRARGVAVLVPSLVAEPVDSGGGAPGMAPLAEPDLQAVAAPVSRPALARYDTEDDRFRGSAAGVRRTPAYARFVASVGWLRDTSGSAGQPSDPSEVEILAVISHREASALLGAWVSADPAAANVLVVFEPWAQGGVDLTAALEAFGGPVLVIWIDPREDSGRVAERVFASRPQMRSLWRLETLSGEANGLVRRPEFCEDLPQWSLKAMRKVGGGTFTDANP